MINIVVAIDKNNGIGKDNQLLVHIKPDLKHFKELTINKTVVMGYNTYLSLPNKPLPNRKNIILTTKDILIDGCEVYNSIDDLLDDYKNEDLYIIGGESIYKQFIDIADKLYITYINESFEADRFFPETNTNEWKINCIKATEENIQHEHPHIFMECERIRTVNK